MGKNKNDMAERGGGGLIANKITGLLREDILSREDGEFLGSEEDLLERFGVSRPTFRQTARMLEQEQILVVKRGLGGGYYTRKPSIETVARAAATYLRTRRTTEQQLIEACKVAAVMLAEEAARSKDEALRAELQRCYAQMRAQNIYDVTAVDFHIQEMEFGAIVTQLAANPALEFFIAALYRVALQEAQQALLADKSERRHYWRGLRLRLAEAIISGEPEVAVVYARRAVESLLEWLAEDIAAGAANPKP